MIMVSPSSSSGGSQALVCAVSGSFAPNPTAPVSSGLARGRSWARTCDAEPSAPTSRSPSARLPSVNHAVTPPFGCSS